MDLRVLLQVYYSSTVQEMFYITETGSMILSVLLQMYSSTEDLNLSKIIIVWTPVMANFYVKIEFNTIKKVDRPKVGFIKVDAQLVLLSC